MKILIRILLVSGFFSILFASTAAGQASVLDPTDSLYTYDVNAKYVLPPNGTIGKWVRTKRLGWNTNSWKAYVYNSSPFRLRFPKSYVAGVADGKKYPLLIFFHGVGEAALPVGNLYDNEYQLYHGGDVFESAVNSGSFDGYVLLMQTTGVGGFWGNSEYQKIKDILDYMVANNKLDPFQVVTNGLSAGGQATWEMTRDYQTYISAAIPMSSASANYEDPAALNNFKYKPIWLFQGALDPAPAAYNTRLIRDSMWAVGANLTYTEYPDLAHGTWDRAWTEPNFFPFIKASYMSNPWPVFGRTGFCPGDPISTTLGLTPGFDSYQWRKDGTTIGGATTNTLIISQTGSYDARVLRGSIWSDWSRIPVVISIKAPTTAPTITAPNQSNVLPALNGNTTVQLQVPAGYVSYLWQKIGENTTLGSGPTLTVSLPADYQVKVTEKFGCSSSFSAPFTVVNANGPNKPDAATSLFATALSQTSIRLDWSANPTPLFKQTKFEIYQATQTHGPYTYAAAVGGDTVSFKVVGLRSNTRYFYIVRAVNNASAAAPSNEGAATTIADTQAPSAPTNLKITGTTRSSIAISWTAATDNVAVVKYKIYVNGQPTYITTLTQFVISGLQRGSFYNIKVVALDLAGNASVFSNQVTGQAILNGLNYKYYTFTGTWSTLADLNAISPLSTGVVANISTQPTTQPNNFAFLYEGYINIPYDGTYTFKTNSDDGSNLYLGSLGGVSSPYGFTNTPLVNNDGLHGPQDRVSAALILKKGTYPIALAFYQQGGGYTINLSWITPVSNGNYLSVPDSAFGDAHPSLGKPLAKPTNLTARGTDYNKIFLSWTRNSTGESGFEIWRSTSPTSNFVTVGLAPSAATSYTDTALNYNSLYYYRVRAIGTAGESDFDLSGQGVDYLYYEQANMTVVPDFTSLTPVSLNQTNHIRNFVLGMANRNTDYAIKYSGTINIPATGIYTFYTASDDGSNLYIDGYDAPHLVVNNDGLHGIVEQSGSKALTAGPHSIYVGYFQAGGGYSLSVSVSATGLQKQLIPDSWLGTPFVYATTLLPPVAPSAPTNLVATGTSKSSISLTWNNPSTNETGIELYRASSSTANYIVYARLAPHTSSFVDTGLFANATYYYKLKALGTVRNSGYSIISIGKTKNINPVINQVPNQSVHFGLIKTIKLSGADADGDILTFSGQSLPPFAQLVNNGNGTASLNLNPSNGDNNTSFSIKILLKDNNGGADSTQFSLVVNNNYDPVISSVADYRLAENSVLAIPLSATDQNPSDILTWSVSNLPNSFTLTPGSNGSATLLLHPNYAAAGAYLGKINVSDGKGGYATSEFNIIVDHKKPLNSIYIRFKDTSNIGAPWNSVTGPISSGFKDETGTASTIGLTFPSGIRWLVNHFGPQTGNNSGVFPDAVLRDFFWFGTDYNNVNLNVAFNGLDPSKRYNIKFFAASNWDAFSSDNGTTIYSVGGQSTSLYVQNNTQNTASLSNLLPASDGTLVFNMSKAPNTTAGFLNALVLTPLYDDGTLPIAPDSLGGFNIIGQGVRLNWRDRSYNESNFEIYRSTNSAGPYSLVGSAGLDEVSYLDKTAIGNTQYYYKIRAVNIIGPSDYTSAVLVITSNKPPIVNAIADVSTKNNVPISVSISTVSDPTDKVMLSAAGLPPFATFTDNGNGSGSIQITPTLGSIGIYNAITVTARDQYDSSGSTRFTLTVHDKDVSSVYLKFTDGSSFAPKPWNNMGSSPTPGFTYPDPSNPSANPIINDDGIASGITIKFIEGFSGSQGLGMRPKTDQTLFPEAISRTGEYDTTATTKQILVSGLKAGNKYNFVFFNSRDDGFNYLTNFSVMGQTPSQTISLNASYNINKTVQINGVVPDASGNATINITKAPAALSSIISAIIIESYVVGSVAILSPADLRVINNKRNSITLQWQDRSDNEAGFEIWRADGNGTAYTLIDNVAADITSYNDINLAPNAVYDYIVRAKTNANVFSSYSNIAVANTLAFAIYINPTTADYQSPSPWNNLNADPVPGMVWNNFLDEQNATTSVGMIEENSWAGTYKLGMSVSGDNGPFPNNVMREGYILFQGSNAILKLTGLNIGMLYDFSFFNSSSGNGDLNTLFTINNKHALLNASVNVSGTLTISNITPDEFGSVEISITTGTPYTQFALLSALIIQAHAPNLAKVVSPPLGSFSHLSDKKIKEQPLNNALHSIAVYPNPFNQSFVLSVAAERKDKLNVVVYDMGGKLVYRGEFLNLDAGMNYLKISTDKGLAPGVYLIKTIFNHGSELKIIKLLKR
ncbi:MAG: hypothetical protein NVSMB67_05330 [Flavisolibacter sp.]